MEIIFTHERLDDFLVIEEMIFNNRLLIDPLDTESDHPCHLVNYSLAQGDDFRCLLDRNVVSYLISLVKGYEISSLESENCFRLAAALQAFFNAADIMSDPGLSYHEYMEASGLDKANEELSSFRAADNVNANYYVDIALGNANKIPESDIPSFPSGELFKEEIPPKLKHFETNIIFLKKALILKSNGRSDYKVMLDLIDWIRDEYLFSAPAFHFLSIYFSSKRIKNMLKSHSLSGIRNATWDLCLIQHLISQLKKTESTNIRWLLSTFDKAIKSTMDLAFVKYYETEDEYFERLEKSYSEMWGKKNGYGKKLLNKLTDFMNSANDESRNIVKYDGSAEYILSLREKVNNEFRAKVVA